LQAKKIASAGYRVLVPDLYRGKLGSEAEEAHHLMSNQDWPGAVADIGGAARFLKAEGSPKVGVTGFCMGGALALAAAVLVPELDAAAPFYGVPNPGLADTKKVRVPVQGHFGGQDPMKGFSDPLAAADLEENLKAAGVPNEVFI
jgi:carboxymethylenebutenolidase